MQVKRRVFYVPIHIRRNFETYFHIADINSGGNIYGQDSALCVNGRYSKVFSLSQAFHER